MPEIVINNKNDMYAYYELINQISPKSVMDIGLFLEQTGNISRHFYGNDIPEDIQLDGIARKKPFPVYETIYDTIYQLVDIGKIAVDAVYDLAMCMFYDEFDESSKTVIMDFVKKHGKYMLIKSKDLSRLQSYGNVISINVCEDAYGVIILKA